MKRGIPMRKISNVIKMLNYINTGNKYNVKELTYNLESLKE